MSSLVPAKTKVAAKRGFIRTTAQAYAASLPTGGVSAAAIAATVADPNPVLLVATAAAAVLSPPLAGLASYLSILSSGIPEDYTAAGGPSGPE
jgi:hypothetical protein